jgi:murein DD-endopeptidase
VFRRRAKGLFDFAVASLAIATFIRATPVGEVAIRSVRWLFGSRTASRPLSSFFENAGDFASSAAASGVKPLPEPLRRALEKIRPDEEVSAVLKGLAVALAPPGATTVEFTLPDPAVKTLLRHGATAAELGTPTGRMTATARALHELEPSLGGVEPALVGVFAGEDEARYAASRARARGEAPSVETMTPHLPLDLRDEMDNTVSPALALATAFDLSWPARPGAPITSPFGMRINPVLGVPKMHTGVDIGVPLMTPIPATSDGVVKRVGDDAVNGRFLVIDHGRGVTTAYCHDTRVLARIGDKVTRGQIVAYSGETGRATGPHLHYQLEIGGTPVDPLPFRSGVGPPRAASDPVSSKGATD